MSVFLPVHHFAKARLIINCASFFYPYQSQKYFPHETKKFLSLNIFSRSTFSDWLLWKVTLFSYSIFNLFSLFNLFLALLKSLATKTYLIWFFWFLVTFFCFHFENFSFATNFLPVLDVFTFGKMFGFYHFSGKMLSILAVRSRRTVRCLDGWTHRGI